MDKFVADFIEAMSQYDEDVVVVMYGDHLPAIDNISDENLKDGRITYQTDYFIWSNFGLEKENKDLCSYQIGSEVLDRIGITNGTMVTFHQNHRMMKTIWKNFTLCNMICFTAKNIYTMEKILGSLRT